MQNRLRLFSQFVRDLDRLAYEEEVVDLLGQSVRILSEVLRFDSAWYGWTQFAENGPVIHASATMNLPDDYYAYWQSMAPEDLLVQQFLAHPNCVATYNRHGVIHTDGMQSLSDTYGLRTLATAMCHRDRRAAALYLSAYRGGERAHPWTKKECEFLQCAVDQMSAVARQRANHRDTPEQPLATSVFVNRDGICVAGLSSILEHFGHIWSKQDVDQLPEFLSDYIDQPGEHVLTDRGVVAASEKVRGADGLELYKLKLRAMRKFDTLTTREQEVAALVASGKTHKEAALTLGVAPSTVRNQIQSIYAKLEVSNRVSLMSMVPEEYLGSTGQYTKTL